jgi:hypothetical protein
MATASFGSSESVLELQGSSGKALYRGKYPHRAAQGLLTDSISKSQLESGSCLDMVKGIKWILLWLELDSRRLRCSYNLGWDHNSGQ